MKTLEQLLEWIAPQNELSRRASDIKPLPNMYAKRDYGKNVGVVLHKVNVRSTGTGKSYGSKAIPERNLGENTMSSLLSGAIELVREAEERKALAKQLKDEHKSIKQQFTNLKAEVEKLKASGGKVKGHPYKKAFDAAKKAKKEVKKLRRKLARGASPEKVQKKATNVPVGAWD